jgi:hypothetical protein
VIWIAILIFGALGAAMVLPSREAIRRARDDASR